jgi:hypothetical protein
MAESIRANISRGYLFRLGMVSLFSIGLAFWCVYDGLLTYPAQRERALKYREVYDAVLVSISSRAAQASRSLTVSYAPEQWSPARWSQQVAALLQEQTNATSSAQGEAFLQLVWFYEQLMPGKELKLDDEQRLALQERLRKQLLKMTADADDYTSNEDSPIHKIARQAAEAWDTEANSRQWPHEYPGEPKNKYAIDQQFYMAAGIVPFGLLFLFQWIRKRGRWVEGDDEGLRNSSGTLFSYGQIAEIDKKRWDKKGIAKVRYEQDGAQKTFVLDDCNYDYQPVRELVRLVESKIDREKIVGGDPEPEETAGEQQAGNEPPATPG